MGISISRFVAGSNMSLDIGDSFQEPSKNVLDRAQSVSVLATTHLEDEVLKVKICCLVNVFLILVG